MKLWAGDRLCFTKPARFNINNTYCGEWTIVNKILRSTLLAAACVAALGCTERKLDPIDVHLQKDRQDYWNLFKPTAENPRAYQNQSESTPPIPEMSNIVTTPPQPKTGQDKIVSISVTEDVPIKDVLLELARLANVDLEMSPDITGGIIFRATNRPFSEVVERIAHLAGLRYSLDKGVLKVERDTPYVQNYSVDFLNMTRSSTNSVNITTNVLSSSGSGGGGGGGSAGGGGLNSGSTSSISSESSSDLWASFEAGIKNILQEGAPSAAGAGAPPAEGGASAATATTSVSAGGDEFFVVNKQGGIVTIKASAAKQKRVNEFIERLRRSATAQVLIEAKIVEVTLNREYQTGINWESFFDDNFKLTGAFGGIDPAQLSNVFSFAIDRDAGLNLDAVVRLVEQFGTARTLSSPRLSAINNQQAVLTFAENEVYFEIEVERETDTTSGNNQELLTVDSQIKTVPIGIILTVQPSINSDTSEVTLNVRPTLSRITGRKEDPAVAFLAAQAGSTVTIPPNQIPVVEVREIESILKMKSGGIMVIGGIMEERNTNNESGVPYLSSIPVVGNVFKGVSKSTNFLELVIFIRATIVPGSNVDPQDINVYRNYTADPRPYPF